jgi:sugar transferase EpsL
MKRVFDFVVAFFVFVSLLPFFLIIGIVVKWKLGDPIIYKQKRPGLHGNPFNLYKLRTMTNQKDSQGNLFPDHIRLTPFGSFLRKYSLDEYPQLINVLKGDMSLVGPRPLLMEYLSLYTKEQFKRHHVRPGITGWAQINGRNLLTWEEKFKLDLWYVENQGFLLDLKILFLTVKKVIKSEGIKNKGHATMPFFKGSVSRNKEM